MVHARRAAQPKEAIALAGAMALVTPATGSTEAARRRLRICCRLLRVRSTPTLVRGDPHSTRQAP
eukprot:scaffold158081_cov32-Tisochrysis_lutea.AAC.1